MKYKTGIINELIKEGYNINIIKNKILFSAAWQEELNIPKDERDDAVMELYRIKKIDD